MNSFVQYFIGIWFCYLLVVSECQNQDESLINATNIHKRAIDYRCTLPTHPEHGQWDILQGSGQPGDSVEWNTIIQFKCHSGYKLSSASQYVVCDANWNPAAHPTCLKLCPPLYSTATTIMKCTDISRQEVPCTEASHGTYLSYDCIAYYEAPLGFKKTLTCRDGQWSYNRPVCQPICGRKVSDAKTLAWGATVLKEIEYPWIAAIYQNTDNGFINVCGGNIISRKVVLTAAHCVTNDYGNKLPAEKFRVGVGKLYRGYMDPRDTSAQYYEVRKVIPYPKYNGESRRYVGDIAIVVIKDLFKWGPVVQPVCISNVDNILLRLGSKGELAGWGVKEGGQPSDELRFLQIPYKNERVCASELPSEWESRYNMEDKMCAGFFRKSISVCRGDSGSGLVFRNTEDNRYYIHGVVSLGPTLKGECNIQQNSLYTKVGFYYEFIDRETNQHYEEQCVLPRYPENGYYIVGNDECKKPGHLVATSTVLTVHCKEGFTLVPPVPTVECENVAYMPKCLLTCPPANPENTESFECVNHEGDYVNCSQAVTGTILKYTCSPGYTTTSGTTSLRSCRNGSWGKPKPGCVFGPTVVIPNDPNPTETTKIEDDGIQVICTYASWTAYKGIRPDQFDATLCTHINYAFAGIWERGDLKVNDDNLDIAEGLYKNVTDLKRQNPNLKVLLSIGGSKTNNTLWSPLVANSAKIDAFIGSAGHFIRTYNFDGINIDWHYPEESEKENYVKFLSRVKEEFDEEGWLLSATARSDFEGTGYDVAKMNEILDWVNVKTYDFYGHWSSYTGEHTALYASSKEYEWEKQHLNVHAVTNNWLKAGLNKTKLVIGVAFYGRTFKLKDKNQHDIHSPIVGPGPGDGIIAYNEICQNYEKWTTVWNDEQKSAFKYNSKQWIAYDTKDAIKMKGAYVKDQGLAGVNVWSLDTDDVMGNCGTKQILLKHLHSGMGHNVRLK